MVGVMRAPLSAYFPAAALAREWLLRNDRGDLASGTASGLQVRLRHASLATAGAPGRPVPRLLRLDARAESGHQACALTWRASDARVPASARAGIESFVRDPWPTWRYRVGETLLEKQLWLVHDCAALVALWRHVEGPPLRIAVTPAVAPGTAGDTITAAPPPPDEDAIAEAGTPVAAAVATGGSAATVPPAPTSHERLTVQAIPGRVRLGDADGHRLTLWHDGAFLPVRSWRNVLDGAADAETRLAPRERGDVPGFVEATLGPGAALHLVISAEENLLRELAERGRLGSPPPKSLAGCVEAIAAGERRHIDAAAHATREAAALTARDAWAARHPDESTPAIVLDERDAWLPRIARGLDAWGSPDRATVAAPAPYLAAGGVEALRTVRGLVALRRFDPAREILLTLGQLMREGLVPSSFEANGTPRYDSPEASLWLVIATETFARRAGEHEFIRHSLFAPLEQVIDRFRAGTRLGVGLTAEGLLAAGSGGVARADLNALWYCAQAAMGQLARALGQKQSGALYIAWAREQQVRFNAALWDECLGAPYVAITPAGPVRGLEPSLLLAASLSPPLLAPDRARSLVAAVERHLLTPAGPREAPDSPRILPGWMGHFLTALVRAHGRDDAVQARARVMLAQFDAALDAFAAGQVPAAFEVGADAALDGSSFQLAGAPVALAGTAELLRFWIEELDHAETAAPIRA